MTITLGGSGDAYFGLPLWLTTECRGRVLRERGSLLGSMSMAGRLPAWIKDAKHRDDVVSAIHRLRVMAAGQSEPQVVIPRPGARAGPVRAGDVAGRCAVPRRRSRPGRPAP
jgi:hypothetical protein